MIVVPGTASVRHTMIITSMPIAVMTTGSETKILTSRHIGRRTSKAISRVTTAVHGNAGNRLVLRGAGGRSHCRKRETQFSTASLVSYRRRLLPDLASIGCRTNHWLIFFAAESLSESRHVGKRADYSVLGNGMGIALNHKPLRLRADLIAAPLTPGDKELLVRGETITGGSRMLLLCLLEGKECDLRPGQVTNAL